MLRRPHIDEPMSKLAAWSSRFALFAFVVAVLSILIVRSNVLEIGPSLATFGAALVCAALAILLAFLSFITIWRQGLRGLRYSVVGMVLGLLLLAYPGYLGYRASKLPAIADITTDTANPPRFDVLARQRPRGTSSYPGATFAQRQQRAYPDIMPLEVEAPTKTVYDVALAVINKRKWQVADARPPVGRREGVIEAVARTLIMGFRDDVVIRISALGNGSRVDMRSASRVGWHDFGANASRIRALLTEIDDTVSSVPEPRRAPEPQKAQPAPKRPAPKR